MADPLSVATSIVGLIAAAGKMIPVLYNIGSSIKDAPELCRAAADELANVTITLQQLYTYVSGKARASIQRLNLITVEHITATLTSCVFAYSELDAVLKALHADTGMRAWDRGMWYIKKDKVTEIVQRLQNYKMTLGLMLNILQCASLSEAEISMDRLCDTVNEVLRTNQELSMRLRNMERLQEVQQSYVETSVEQQAVAGATGGESDDSAPSASSPDAASVGERPESLHDRARLSGEQARSSGEQGRPSGEQTVGLSGESSRPSHFEELLHRSRVYRHVSETDYTPSLMSAARSTLAFSISSSLTLGEVSNISVYAIPIYAIELSNAECYHFGAALDTVPSSDSSTTDDATSASTSSPPERRTLRTWLRAKRSEPKPSLAKTADLVPSAENRVFGVDLEVSIRYANVAISLFNEEGESYIYGYIPIVVAKCGVYLKERGTDVVGIFEVSGALRRVKELCAALDRPPRYGKGLDWTGFTVIDAGNVLLRYLLQMPEPLIPFAFYERFRDPLRNHQAQAVGILELQEPCVGDFDLGAAILQYQALVTDLPPMRRFLLLYVLDLLAVFASKSDLNKMTTMRLAAVFQSGFLNHPDDRLSWPAHRLSQDVLIFLIDNQDSFLIGMPGSSTPLT